MMKLGFSSFSGGKCYARRELVVGRRWLPNLVRRGGDTMYYVRLLENFMLSVSDYAWTVRQFYNKEIRPYVGPGFLNAWNYYIDPY